MKLLNTILLLAALSCALARAEVSVIVARDQSPELALQLYERLTAKPVTRDSSLEGAHGLLYFRTDHPLDREEAAAVVASYLKMQTGIVIVEESGGTTLAKYDPDLPLEPIGNVIRQKAGDLGFGGLIQVEENTDEKHLRIKGVIDAQGLRAFQGEIGRLLEDTDYEVSLTDVSLVSSEELKQIRVERDRASRASPERMSDIQRQIIERREARRRAAEAAAADDSHGQADEGGNSEGRR